MSNTYKPELPVEVVEKILKARDALIIGDKNEAYHQLYGIASPGYDSYTPWKEMEEQVNHPFRYEDQIKAEVEVTAYATQLHQLQQENAELRRWKMEAAELLTKIHSYAHKHLEIKLGESTVEFVIARAKERDGFKLGNDRLKIALENVCRIHGAQWTQYDRGVIEDLIK